VLFNSARSEEVENELFETLSSLKSKAIDVEAREIKSKK